jgi:hypothetical protein
VAQRHWLLVVPVLLFLGLGSRIFLNPAASRGADHRIMTDRLLELEAKVGYHLYAPTWLPNEGRTGNVGAMQGAKRILQDFTDNQERSLCILSQERRNEDRDRYHKRIFVSRAEARGKVGSRTAYFVTGSSGERRLFWNEKDAALILSSCVLTDQELLEVAQKVK